MDNAQLLELLKLKLGIATKLRDKPLEKIIEAVKTELEDNLGVLLDLDSPEDQMFVVDFAAFRYEGGVDMPRHLLWRLHNLKTGLDKLHQPLFEEKRLTILCRKRSITRSEFYQASQVGLRPSLILDIHSFEYNNEEEAEFNGKRYRILKTFPIGLEILELTLMEELP